MMDFKPQIQEIIADLDVELAATADDQKKKPLRLANGTLSAVLNQTHLYVFPLTSKPNTIDIGPANIRIRSTEMQCEIVTLQPESLSIAINCYFGDVIQQAHLHHNKKDLLESLKERFEHTLTNEPSLFRLGSEVYAGRCKQICDSSTLFQRNPELAQGLNDSQRKAVEKSYSQSFSILWGPPGTGKTNTIAKLVRLI